MRFLPQSDDGYYAAGLASINSFAVKECCAEWDEGKIEAKPRECIAEVEGTECEYPQCGGNAN